MSKIRVLLSTAEWEVEPIDELVITDERLTHEELRKAIAEILERHFDVEYD